MFTILTAILTSLIICYLVSRYYERYLRQYQEMNQFHHQTIRCQAERIEQLEQERARLHWQLLAHLSEPGQEVNAYRN